MTTQPATSRAPARIPRWATRILPVVYAASMFVSTRLNPQPADPVQARIMLIMPIMFSVFFLFFPAGLVLYWVVQNLLSIVQQWYINRTLAAEAKAKAHR